MSQPERPLAGLAISLSISESDDSAYRGFPPWQVNRVTLQVVAALFGQGASVVFGHDWREDGVMEAVHGFARQMQSCDWFPVAVPAREPLLQNLLPWPDRPQLSVQDLERLAPMLRVEAGELPPELRARDAELRVASQDSPLYLYSRARALTYLRHRLDERCHARLSLGGRRGGAQGRYPGVIEESLFAVNKYKPLYAAGLLGGATRQVIDAIEGRPIPEDFCRPTKVAGLYAAPPHALIEVDPNTQADREVNAEGVWSTFKGAGVSELSRANRLTEGENQELFHTPSLDRVIQLVLMGLSRLTTERRP